MATTTVAFLTSMCVLGTPAPVLTLTQSEALYPQRHPSSPIVLAGFDDALLGVLAPTSMKDHALSFSSWYGVCLVVGYRAGFIK